MSEPKRYASKLRPNESDEENSVYGWYGDGWYYMDENGMLVGGRHPNKTAAQENAQRIKEARARRAKGSP